MTRTITFATGNDNKLEEARTQLEPLGFTIERYEAGYPELQAASLEAVAHFGLAHLAERAPEPFMLEDAGLFVDALGGFPGVYSSYAFSTIGNDGILTLLGKTEDRTARFRSVIGLQHEGEQFLFVGEVQGRIAREKQGEHGFGFDPIFQPDGHEATFAQMTPPQKTEISHRSLALAKLQDHLDA